MNSGSWCLTGGAAAALVLAAAGCSEPGGRLAGRVTSAGRPVTDAVIHFRCPETGVIAWAPLSADGGYAVPYAVPEGAYRAWVAVPVPVPEPGRPPAPAPENRAIPRKYRDEATSGLSVTVRPGANAFDVDLKD